MLLKDMCFEARRALDDSQKAFAKKIGSNQTEVSFIERGFIPEDKEKVNAIREIFNREIGGFTHDN